MDKKTKYEKQKLHAVMQDVARFQFYHIAKLKHYAMTQHHADSPMFFLTIKW